jgi:predicted PurR-regulated permease PerM
MVGITLHKIERVVRSYILGMFIVILIVAVLNSLGLMLLGIQHAIFFGVLAAILIVIPYVGIIVGSLLPILFALVTKDSLWYPVGVLGLFWGVQVLEGNFITPNIVGNKVSINPFAAILALFFSGIVWGIPGMVLSIPLLAIFKVICDAVKPLQSIGFLLGVPPKEDGGHDFKAVNFHSVLNGNKLKT